MQTYNETYKEQKSVFTNGGYFSFFNPPIDAPPPIIPSSNGSLKDLFTQITNGSLGYLTQTLRAIQDKKKKGKFKTNNLPYCTPNGIATQRHQDHFTQASLYFVADHDDLHDPEAVFTRLTSDLVLRPVLVFRSPSGDGIKAIYRIDADLIDHEADTNKMHKLFYSLNTYYSKYYDDLITPDEKGNFICAAGKDLLRACFLCDDPKAYYNPFEESVIDNAFFDKYYKVPETKKSNSRKVSPATTINDLAVRHLMQANNHHNHIIRFAGAARSIGVSLEDTLTYIRANVQIAPDSSHSDADKMRKEVEDIYNRFNTDSPGVQRLTELSFGYELLHFKYSREAKGFVVSSLFLDEVRNILHRAGFAKRKIGKAFLYVQTKGCIIKEVSPEQMRDYCTNYVTSIEESICFTYQGEVYQIPPAAVRETYLKNSNNVFNSVWLEHLQIHDDPVLKDTDREMYFFFNNCIVTVSADGIKTEEWDSKNGFCIWEDQIINHDFEYTANTAKSHFQKFLHNVTNNDPARLLTMYTGLGYLMHHHFKESEGQAVVFYDETITDTQKPMGGSGKGLIVNAIKQVRMINKVDGKHLDSGNRFRYEQITPSTQVVWIDDVKPDFEFSQLYSNLTDGWTIERKYLPQFMIAPTDSPKTVICSNSIIKGAGTTNKRRQFIIELSDYYSKQIVRGDEKPIEQTHGCIFFSRTQWETPEWNMFFSVMFNCAYQYLNTGLSFSPGVNLELNRFRQATDEDFAAWVTEQNFSAAGKYPTKVYYEQFVKTYYGEHYQIGQRKFTGFLKEFASYKGWKFDIEQANGVSYFKF